MNIPYSKKGDLGQTSLMGGQRVLKCDIRPETYGTIDEASSALGMARASSPNQKTKSIILNVQKDLLILAAELATLPEDESKFTWRINANHVEDLERLLHELHKDVTIGKAFIYPGANLSSASIDLARTIIRRAERQAVRLTNDHVIGNENVLKFLNRLADLLFTLARYEERDWPNHRSVECP